MPAEPPADTHVSTGTKRKLSRGGTEPQKGKRKQVNKGDEPYNPGPREDALGNLNRDTSLGAIRKRMDGGKCVVMGTANPEACHIIPWASCKNAENLAAFSKALGLLAQRLFPNSHNSMVTMRHFIESPGVSDKTWNMISLNPQLHVWWGKAYFAFKCLGILNSDEDNMSLVQIQFYWMPNATTLWKDEERDEGELRRYLTSDRSSSNAGILAFYTSGRPVVSGDTFKVRVESVHAQKMKMAFDIQWALARIAAMAGAADVTIAGLPPDDDEGPPDTRFIESRVHDWVALSYSFPPLEEPPALPKLELAVRTNLPPPQEQQLSEAASPANTTPLAKIATQMELVDRTAATPTPSRLPRPPLARKENRQP